MDKKLGQDPEKIEINVLILKKVDNAIFIVNPSGCCDYIIKVSKRINFKIFLEKAFLCENFTLELFTFSKKIISIFW